MIDKPAIIGGKPIFEKTMPILLPPISKYSKQISGKIAKILESNIVTNSSTVKELENSIKHYLSSGNITMVSSCTSGMILSLELLGLRGHEVLLPSFTFCATAHAAYWDNAKLKFVDIDPDTFTVSATELQNSITKNTKAILATHIYGNPCDVKAIQDLADDHGLKVIYDAAHAFGSMVGNKKIGNFGDVEVFSCSPTKLFSTIEGGIVSTSNPNLASQMALARNYGSPADYDCPIIGLNARLSEINAAVGIEYLKDIEEYVENRNNYVTLYKKLLSSLPGIRFQSVKNNTRSTFKDFTLLINPEEFGLPRDQIYAALKAENIESKKYFYPPVHKMKAYHMFNHLILPNTENISNNVLSLPIYNIMDKESILGICSALEKIHLHCNDIKRALTSKNA